MTNSCHKFATDKGIEGTYPAPLLDAPVSQLTPYRQSVDALGDHLVSKCFSDQCFHSLVTDAEDRDELRSTVAMRVSHAAAARGLEITFTTRAGVAEHVIKEVWEAWK